MGPVRRGLDPAERNLGKRLDGRLRQRVMGLSGGSLPLQRLGARPSPIRCLKEASEPSLDVRLGES